VIDFCRTKDSASFSVGVVQMAAHS